jgi:hypothetical protein
MLVKDQKVVGMSRVLTLRVFFILVVLLVSASLCFINVTFAEISDEEASSALANAERTLVSAYQAVLKAEESGANASVLLAQLNDAGEFLARARMVYRAGNFGEVSSLASASKTIGVEVEYKATKLKNSAISEGLQRMISTMIVSVVGMGGIILGSYWAWRFLKKRYSAVSNL